MNCDQVFDILTRGPFPTGAASDLAVEAHLERCGACRRLAEALRPAVELLDEAIADESRHSLPGYRGSAATLPRTDRFRAAPPRQQKKRKGSQPRVARDRPLGAVVGGLTAGLLVGVLFWSYAVAPSVRQAARRSGLPADRAAHSVAPTATATGPAAADAGRRQASASATLARWDDLPTACRAPASAESTATLADLLVARCCSECHAKGAPLERPAAKGRVAASCMHCHKT